MWIATSSCSSRRARAIRDGHAADSLPLEYTGGLGNAGVTALREFVRAGGRLVAIKEATEFAIDLFDLPVRNAVEDLRPQDFCVPGSILRLDVDANDPLAGGVGNAVHGWYWSDSRAFDVTGEMWTRRRGAFWRCGSGTRRRRARPRSG